MPREVSQKRKEIERILIQRIAGGVYSPGNKFMSNRAVATEFGVNILTAHRILNQLAEEGYLDRRACSGSFVPGSMTKFRSINLIFNALARNSGSFNSELLNGLKKALSEQKIPWKVTWLDKSLRVKPDEYNVTYQFSQKRIDRQLAQTKMHGLLIGGIPSIGTHASYFDSVSVDYFHAGVLAGKYLKKRLAKPSVAILGNPPGRSSWVESAILGFRSVWPRARIIHPQSWSIAMAPVYIAKLFTRRHEGVFCTSRRQVLDVLAYCSENKIEPPRMISMSLPPVPEQFPAPLICVSVNQVVEAASRIILNRFYGDNSPTVHLTIAPKIVGS